jgi:membrane-associated protease RseP (regulator of RpoE activity)
MDGVIFTIVAIVLFVVVLGGIVLVHELGHYLTAKALGVRVLEFGIGFPPRARVLRSKGETLWTLNWLPIGGFVRLEGEDGNATDDPPLDPRRRRRDEHRPGVRALLPDRPPGHARLRRSHRPGRARFPGRGRRTHGR